MYLLVTKEQVCRWVPVNNQLVSKAEGGGYIEYLKKEELNFS